MVSLGPYSEDFFAGELAKYGYTSVYKKKTAQVFSQGTYVIDGRGLHSSTFQLNLSRF